MMHRVLPNLPTTEDIFFLKKMKSKLVYVFLEFLRTKVNPTIANYLRRTIENESFSIVRY